MDSNDEATIMRDVHAAASAPGLVDASCPVGSTATPPQPKPVSAKNAKKPPSVPRIRSIR